MSAAHRERRACVSLPAAPGQDFPGTSLASIPGARLRGLRFADAGDLTLLHHDPAVRRVTLDPVPTAFLGIASLIIRSNRMHADQPGLGVWHASDRDGRFAGLLSLVPVAAGDIELGLRLMPSMAMHAAIGAALEALCRHAFDTLGLLKLAAQVHVADAVAMHWLVHCGFEASNVPARHGAHARAYVLDHRAWAQRERRRVGADPGSHGG